MNALRGLLKVDTMAQSLGLYVPAMVVQKTIGLGRTLLFLWFMDKSVGQYSLWTLSAMTIVLAAPIFAMGSNQGLARYVSFYEARGQLHRFYRRVIWPLAAMAMVLAAVALLFAKPIAMLTLATKGQGWNATGEQLAVCRLAVVNGLLVALFNNVLGMVYGLRTYRLACAMELFFGILFTAISVPMLWLSPSAVTALLAHLASLAVTLALAMLLLHVAVRRISSAATATVRTSELPVPDAPTRSGLWPPQAQDWPPDAPLAGPSGADPTTRSQDPLAQVLWFGLAAMAGYLLWAVMGDISLYLTNRLRGKSEADVFAKWLLAGQAVLLPANAAWAVIFSHVARQWEARRQGQAVFWLQTSYKYLVICMMSVSVILYLGAPLWMRALTPSWHGDTRVLGGLFMSFQMTVSLGILAIVARLHERPIIVAVCALAAGTVNAALALWWIPQQGLSGAAWSAGIGTYVGGGLVAGAYLLCSRARLHWSIYLLLILPGVFLLAAPWAGAVWGAILLLAVFTPLVFDRQQKQLLVDALRNRLGMG